MNKSDLIMDHPAATSASPLLRDNSALSALESAVLNAVSYAEVFDFPLTAAEVQFNLVSYPASLAAVQFVLANSRHLSTYLDQQDGYYFLRGKESSIATRRQRFKAGSLLWPQARAYGRILARVPFVRLVAVTGALAVNNAREGDDIDYLIVTEPGRLWLCRALIILLVKIAARQGNIICPNYFLSTEALALSNQDLFTAHELLQMRPLFGFDIYCQMLSANSWAQRFLPNAFAARTAEIFSPKSINFGKRALERFLRLPPVDWLEQWEMKRKIAKFSRQIAAQPLSPRGNNPGYEFVEVAFSARCCKGHFNQHGRETLAAYAQMLKKLESENPADRGHYLTSADIPQPELTFPSQGD